MTEEKSSAAIMSKKAITSDIILPDDDDAIHSRHTFSSRQKMQEASNRRRSKNARQRNKQQRDKNNMSSVGIISPLSDGTNVRQGEARKCSANDSENSDMKWSTIGNTKLSGTQELDKLASLIPQPVSPECSVEETANEDEEEYKQPRRMAAVSPEASSPAMASHQKQQLLHSNFKTPRKTPTSYQNIHQPSAQETPITELFNYYNFSTTNNNSSEIDNDKLSPTTSNMLETSPFRKSSKLLDDQLQSVLEADRNMDRKIEQMEKNLDDSYMGSPMSGTLHDRDDSSDDDNTADDKEDKITSDSKDESMSTFSDAMSELIDGADHTTRLCHLQSPDTKSDVEFLTPKSRLVVKGQRAAGTAYFTARNVVDGDNAREGIEESRMYDSDSETNSVRRMNVQLQLHQRPRSASYDAVSSRIIIDRDMNTTSHAVLDKVRRSFMSPPAEFRTTRVLWRDDTTPMRVASLHWEFDAEEKPVNKRALSGNQKKKKSSNASKPQTPFSSKSTDTTVLDACPLQLRRIAEEQTAAFVQSDSEALSERTEFLNVINVLRIQVTQLENERDSVVAERDEQAQNCNEYKMEKEALSSQIKTLEEEVQVSHQVLENVKETLSSKVDETGCLKQLLQKSEEDLRSLRTTLLSKEGEVEELSLALKDKEDGFEARLQTAERERLIEFARVTNEMKQAHSDEIEILESKLKEAHTNELNSMKVTLSKDFEEKSNELLTNHALLVEQLQVSSSEDVARVRCEAEKEHLAAVEAMVLRHTQEIASTVERLNVSHSQAIDDLKAAHSEEVKLLQDGSNKLKATAEQLRKEKDDFIMQISSLKKANEGLEKTLSTQEEDHRHSLEAAKSRELASTERCTEIDAMLKESDANLALVRDDNNVLGGTVANLTKRLEAKQADLESVMREKDAIEIEMKRQLLDSQTEIESMMLTNKALESKHAALLQENCFLKESNSTVDAANAALQTSLGEVSNTLSEVTKEKEELIASLGEATSNMNALKERIASANSELEIEKRRNEELSKENEEASHRGSVFSTQIKCLQSEVESANEENNKITAELDALACLEGEIREELETSKDERKCLREEIANLQSLLFEANKDRDHLSHELKDMSSLRQEMSLDNQSNEMRVSELESEVRALSTVKHILQLKSNKIESLNAAAQVELDESNNKIVRLSEENNVANAELVELKSKLQVEIDKTANLVAEKSDIEEQLKSAESERDDLQQKLDEAVLSCETMSVSLEDARLEIQLKSDEIESMSVSSTAKLDEVNEILDALRGENVATLAELKELQSQLQSESTKMANVRSEKASVEVLLKSTRQERDDLQQKFDEAFVSCESMLLSLEDARSQIRTQSSEIESINASAAADLGEVKNEIYALREENVATKAALELLRSEKSTIEQQLNATQEERDDLQQRFDEAAVSLEYARSQIQAQSSKIELLNITALSECEDLSKKMVAVQEEKAGIEVQLKSTQQERDDLQQKFDEAVVSCESMLLSLEDARSQIRTQSSEIDSLHTCAASEVVEVNKKLDVLREENVATKAELELLRSEKSTTELQLNATQEERDDLQHRFDEAVISCESMLLSLEDARSQIQAQSSKMELLNTTAASDLDEARENIDAVLEEKAGVELQLKAIQQERDNLVEKFDEAVVSCESMLLTLEEARLQMQVNTNQVERMEAQLADNYDAFACLQASSAMLAANVLQLKFRFKNEMKKNDALTSEIELRNERVTYLETCLEELKNDNVVEQNLKSTVAKLAFALVKLKARERRALTVQQTLEASNIDLLTKLGVMSKENEGMEEGMTVLTDKINALELDSSSNHVEAELQKAVSERDAEVKRLGDLLAGKDESLRDLMSEMQKIRSDVMNGVKKLESEHSSAMKARDNLEEELEAVNIQLSRESELVFDLQSQLEQAISEKNMMEDDMVDLQGTQLHLENHLEQVVQDRMHLRTQIEDFQDSIAALEADKDSLTMKLEEYEDQAEYFTSKIAKLEANAKASARQIDYMEFQLVSKMDEAEALNKMVMSHEATMKDLNDEIEAMDAKRTKTEESLSSLHSKMDTVVNERDGLASQLQCAIEELASARAEWETVRSSAGSSFALTPSKVEFSQEVEDFASSPGQGIRKILESSKLSKEDIDFICSNMEKSKTILTQVGKERRFLKKEVKRLRAELEQAQGELTAVKKNYKIMNQQTIALRGDISQAKSLLKEYEAEKNQLTSDLSAAHEAMDQIQRCSSESYQDLVQQSRDEIAVLKNELESKDEAIEQLQVLRNDHISKFDITSDSIQSSQQQTVVTSTERFKVAKGQSMFGMLKGKRTKRKGNDQLSYRKRK
ncbi:hypothetical protein ACHAWT_001796 [Skeletonema menzelii]